MSQREKLLGFAVAALVVLWGGTVGLARYREAVERNEQVEINTTMALSQARTAEARGRRAQRLLHQWRQQSLPSNVDIAKSKYQDWLRLQLEESFMIVKEIREQSPRSARANYRQASFIVTAQGSLEKLTDFLYRFYQSNHLHRISTATLVPTSSRKSLTATLTVDALSLPDCARDEDLAEGSQETFEDSFEKIEEELLSRNIFLAYEPPQPPEPEVQEQPDTESMAIADTPDEEAASAFITSMTRGADGWQMSIRMIETGQLYYFSTGDTIEIGRFSAKVERLDGRRVILSASQGKLELVLGQNLSQARELHEDSNS